MTPVAPEPPDPSEPLDSREPPDSGEPPEHARFAAYLSALEQGTDAEEPALLSRILTDPDPTMAQSAVVRHVDRRAADLALTSAYDAWVESTTRATAGHPFLAARLEEWTLLRAITLSHPWTQETLTQSSNWLQLKLAEAPNTPASALALLAAQGRTRRIRHAAATNLRQPNQD